MKKAHKIEVKVRFEFAHRLLNYTGKCNRIHGHTDNVIVTLGADQLNSQGMIVDFGAVKSMVRGFIDDFWDHSIILNNQDPLIGVLEALYDGPSSYFAVPFEPTSENLAKYLFDEIDDMSFGPASIQVERVEFQETPVNTAIYERI